MAASCRVCGCTDLSPCVYDPSTGQLLDVLDPGDIVGETTLPLDHSLCWWVEPDLCSADVINPPPPLLYGPDGQPLRGAP